MLLHKREAQVLRRQGVEANIPSGAAIFEISSFVANIKLRFLNVHVHACYPSNFFKNSFQAVQIF